jgi:hypothetical protein
VRNQARINNAAFTLTSIKFFAEIVVSFGPEKSIQMDCDYDDDDDDDDDNYDDDDDDDDDQDDIFFDEMYIWNQSAFLIFLWGSSGLE